MQQSVKQQSPTGPADERIARLRLRYQTEPPKISVERARYFTESWQATEERDCALPVRVALAMRNVYRKMTIYIDPDDRIAGYWTESFTGIPVDIERGVFNRVFEAELDKKVLTLFRGKAAAKGLAYMLRKRSLGDFIKNQQRIRETGAQPMNMSLKTMPEREINPFDIDDADRKELLDQLLPYWRGRCVVDLLEEELTKAGLHSDAMHDFVTALPGNTSRQVLWLSTCTTIASLQGHVILDYETVLAKGLIAMQNEVRAKLAEERDDEKRALYESLDISLEGVMTFARRLAERLRQQAKVESDPAERRVLSEMAETCAYAPLRPARTFREAVQALWTIKTAVELAHPVNLHCFGRLDQNLISYYRNDIEAGTLTPSTAQELLEELLLKIMSQNIRPESNILAHFYHRFLGSSPVTLGGLTPDGDNAENELTRLFIRAAHSSKAITNVSLRVHPQSSDDVLHEVARALQEGTSSFSLFNDEVVVEAMKRREFADHDARDYAIMGCVEATCPGKTGSMSANALQLMRLLDITLRNGDSRILAGVIKQDGPATGDPDDFASFDDLLDAFFTQARRFIKQIVLGSNLRDKLYAEHLPAPLISAFMDGCLKSGRDVTAGGARYDLSGISMINSIANLVDSLLVIKKLVYERRRCTIGQLMNAVDENFVGSQDLLAEIKNVSGKWGNGDVETDELARRVTAELFGETYRYRNYRGGPFVVYVISMTTHTIEGRLSPASPDGRRAATPYAASSNPDNVDRAGVTAVLKSVARLPNEDVMGGAVNVKFHPSAIGQSAVSRDKWIALMRTYFQLGGQQIQPTVVSTEQLRRAQADPDAYRDLVVKVGGYSTYFVDLGNEIQNEIIARSEHRQ